MTRTLLIGLVAACALVGWGCGEKPDFSATTVTPSAEIPNAETAQAEAATAELTDAVKVEAPTVDSPEVQTLIGEATALLEQATQYVKDNKLDLAKSAIDTLIELKPLLPSEWQSKIDAVMALYNTKNALGGMKLPAY